jgi:hypothetical protein
VGSAIQDSHCPYQPFGCQTRPLLDRSQRRRVDAAQKSLHDCLHYTNSVNQEEAEISQNSVFRPVVRKCSSMYHTRHATIACTPYACRDFGQTSSLRPSASPGLIKICIHQQGSNVKFRRRSHISIRLMPRFSPETSQPTLQGRKRTTH